MSYVPLPERFVAHFATTLATHTDSVTSSSLLTDVSLGGRFQIHLKGNADQDWVTTLG